MSQYSVGLGSKSADRFEWTIPNFYRHMRAKEVTYVESPVFSSSEIEWVLTGCLAYFEHITLGLRLTRPVAFPLETPMECTFGFKSPEGEILEGETHTAECNRLSSVAEFAFVPQRHACAVTDRRLPYQILKFKHTLISRSEFLRSGNLTITFRFRIRNESAPPTTQAPDLEECSSSSIPIDKMGEKDMGKSRNITKLVEDFKDLLLNETDSDVILKVSDKEFKVHRLIIRTRSPVLFAMFAHDTEERRTGVVNIEDCDPDTFPDFLRYVYTGEVEALTTEKALHLYRTADKYQLQELKEQCLELLKRGVSVDNFCDVLSLSLQHNERELTEVATNFFVDNPLEISLTPRWQTFLREDPTTANELNIKGFRKMKK